MSETAQKWPNATDPSYIWKVAAYKFTPEQIERENKLGHYSKVKIQERVIENMTPEQRKYLEESK